MEAFLIIRFFGLLLVALYVYGKILHIQTLSKAKIIAAIIFALLMSLPLSYVPPFYELIFLGSCCLFLGVITKVKPTLLLTAVFISTGISLGIEVLAFTLTMGVSSLIDFILQSTLISLEIPPSLPPLWNALQEAIVVSLSIIIARFFFRLKRLKSGFVFLESRQAKWLGIIFSVIIMLARSVLDQTIPLLVGINISTIGLYVWWQYHTTILYQQRINHREINRCLAEIKARDEQIQKLTYSNQLLAKGMHRDNKLIPAMYAAVNSFLQNTGRQIDSDNQQKGKTLLQELEEIMAERKETLLQIQDAGKTLPTTEIERIDYILQHMLQQATQKQIHFDVIVLGQIKSLAESLIAKAKLETVLADLIENAIIALSSSSYKKILVTLAVVEGQLEISVQDSGTPFEISTLLQLGKEKVTTHRASGGSGIGYLTIFEILKETGASLIISEPLPQEHSFSKSVKVRFDNQNEYIIYSYRGSKIPSQGRDNMIILVC